VLLLLLLLLRVLLLLLLRVLLLLLLLRVLLILPWGVGRPLHASRLAVRFAVALALQPSSRRYSLGGSGARCTLAV
jgi:hypothetical protein